MDQIPQRDDGAPRIGYWHLWTDADGVSHQTRCELSRFAQASMGGAAPQWNDSLGRGGCTVIFSVQPVGWIGEWHENPAPQWIVPLSGRWWVESMDGQRVEMGPGEAAFGEDQHCVKDASGRRGHRSCTLGKDPARLMIVQMHGPSTIVPCHVK
jgi:hypothetical protein